MKQRNLFWDNYKGILIFLVVFGHCIYSYAQNIPDSFVKNLYIFIYSFHMPAFIFCSGYFSKSENSRSKKSLVTLLLYYLVFNTIMMFFDYFYIGKDFKLLTPYYSYWYILSLIIWRAIVGILGDVRGIVGISFIISLLVGYWGEFSNLLSLRRSVAFFVFFVAGYHLSESLVEKFLCRRKMYHMILGYILTISGVILAFWAVRYFDLTSSMTLMGTYKNDLDIFRRLLIFLISFLAIICMFLVIPNCKIPFLSQIGKNSLLIYLFHRFFTIIYYKDIFHYKSYSAKYILYSFIASIIICIIFGNGKLNEVVASFFGKVADILCSLQSIIRKKIIFFILIMFTLVLGIKMIPSLKLLVGSIKNTLILEEVDDTIDNTAFIEDISDKEEYVLSDEQKNAIDRAIKIAYVGDLILLKDQVTSAFDVKTNTYSFDEMFEYATPYLEEADFAIGVFEGTMAGDDKDYSTSNYGDGLPLHLSFPDEFASAIKEAGIDLVSTANNHLLDMKLDGALRTLDVLDEVGIKHTGSYRTQEEKDNLLIIEVDGVKIAVLSYLKSINFYEATTITEEFPYLTSVMPYKSNPYYNQLLSEIENDFARAKESEADMILVMAHMGTQFQTSTNAFQDKWNKIFSELGADIILGDHAHIVQPIQYIGDTVVVNCPGNFANSFIAYDGDATSIVEIYIDKETKNVIATSIIPMYTQEFKKGYFRALPIYSIMSNEHLKEELWSRDHARIQEIHSFITDIMLQEAISLKDISERYFYINNNYYRK